MIPILRIGLHKMKVTRFQFLKTGRQYIRDALGVPKLSSMICFMILNYFLIGPDTPNTEKLRKCPKSWDRAGGGRSFRSEFWQCLLVFAFISCFDGPEPIGRLNIFILMIETGWTFAKFHTHKPYPPQRHNTTNRHKPIITCIV